MLLCGDDNLLNNIYICFFLTRVFIAFSTIILSDLEISLKNSDRLAMTTCGNKDAMPIDDIILNNHSCEMSSALLKQLKKIRQDNHLTQAALAAAAGICQPVIARIESLSTNPQIRTVARIASALGRKLVIVPLESNNDKAQRSKKRR